MKFRIEKIENSTSLVLPDELVAKPNLEPGQWLEVSELPGGGIRLTPRAADFNKAWLYWTTPSSNIMTR